MEALTAMWAEPNKLIQALAIHLLLLLVQGLTLSIVVVHVCIHEHKAVGYGQFHGVAWGRGPRGYGKSPLDIE